MRIAVGRPRDTVEALCCPVIKKGNEFLLGMTFNHHLSVLFLSPDTDVAFHPKSGLSWEMVCFPQTPIIEILGDLENHRTDSATNAGHLFPRGQNDPVQPH